MKPEGLVAYEFLVKLDAGTLAYEPDGNIPPDFALGDRIGVEVRRLNQILMINGKHHGAEEISIPLWDAFTEVLSSFDEQFQGKSYWVGIVFNDSLGKPTKAAKREIRRALQAFIDGRGQAPVQVSANSFIELWIYETQAIDGRVFRPAVQGPDEAVSVIQAYVSSIQYSIATKTLIVAPFKSRYPEWWLLLVDAMGWHLGPNEQHILRSETSNLGCFSRLVVLDYNARPLFDMGL